MGLSEDLAAWSDVDIARARLGHALGLFPYPDSGQVRIALWENQPITTGLWDALRGLVAAGVFEHRREPDHEFRWSDTAPTFDGPHY